MWLEVLRDQCNEIQVGLAAGHYGFIFFVCFSADWFSLTVTPISFLDDDLNAWNTYKFRYWIY